MQFLTLAIETIAANSTVDSCAMLLVKLLAVFAKIGIRVADVV